MFRQYMELGGRDSMMEQLRRASVFFSYLDAKAERMRIAGSGVIVDVRGTKVVLTAGHVLDDFKDQFASGEMVLSVNRAKGRLVVPSASQRLVAPGGTTGPDAGVLVLPLLMAA